MCPSSSTSGFGGLATSSASDTCRYKIRFNVANRIMTGKMETARIVRHICSESTFSALAPVGAISPGPLGSPKNGSVFGSCPNNLDAMHKVPTHAAAP